MVEQLSEGSFTVPVGLGLDGAITKSYCHLRHPSIAAFKTQQCHPFFDWLIQNGIALMDMSPGPGPHPPWYGPHMAEPPIYTLFAAC